MVLRPVFIILSRAPQKSGTALPSHGHQHGRRWRHRQELEATLVLEEDELFGKQRWSAGGRENAEEKGVHKPASIFHAWMQSRAHWADE
jgi:hypothetical protein